MKYFEFQYTWGDIMARMESDGGLRQALVQAAIARQSGGEVVVEAAAPVGASADAAGNASDLLEPAAANLDPGMTAEIRLSINEE